MKSAVEDKLTSGAKAVAKSHTPPPTCDKDATTSGQVPVTAKKSQKTKKVETDYFYQSVVAKKLKRDFQTVRDAVRYGHIVPRQIDNKISLSETAALFRQRDDAKNANRDLILEERAAKIEKLNGEKRLRDLQEAEKRGELHSIKDCVASIGLLLSSVWMEVQALPNRIQSAHPEIHGLDKTATDIVNLTADRLLEFAKEHGAEIRTKT